MGAEALAQRSRDVGVTLPPIRPEPHRTPPPRPRVRIAGRRLLVCAPDLFENDDTPARRLVEHAFSLDEVQAVAVRRERGEVSLLLAPLADAEGVWRRLGTLLRAGVVDRSNRAARLDLKGPLPGLPVRIGRAGDALTTFRARVLGRDHLRISHPLLRDRDVRLRLADVLRALHGVTDVRAASFRPVLRVAFDPASLEAERILRFIEGAWPEILGGPPVTPRPRKLYVAGGLLAFSVIAQFLRPVLLPWATAAVVLYSLPNVIGAARDLARGRVGLYALYTTGLGFLLWTRLPFAASLMATFFQAWPALAQRVVVTGERRLFAERRRRPISARLKGSDGAEILVDLGDVMPGSTVVVRAGEFVPADGLLVEGRAAVEEDMLNGARGATDRSAGDPVYAGTFVRDGTLTVRVTRTGSATAAAALARALPFGALQGLPSSAAVERVANRNAKPALAAAALLLIATRVPRFSQVVIRPDYATGPRLSAHLSALAALAEALNQGALVRKPAALDLLSSVEVFVFDDAVDFSSRATAIKKINVTRRSAAPDALGLAAAALAGSDDHRAAALMRDLGDLGGVEAKVQDRRQRVDETVFRDGAGALVSVTTPGVALRRADSEPHTARLRALVDKLAAEPPGDPAEHPLVVVRDRRIIGVVQFARQGEPRVAEVIATLRVQFPDARFVHVSSARQDEAESNVEGLGFDAVFGGLDAEQKAGTLRSLGMRAVWIGDGTDPGSALARAASTLSISLGGLDRLPRDETDVVLLRDDLQVLTTLRPIVDAHVARLRSDYRTIYAANLLAVTGGFTVGLGSLGAGLTSNLGSALVFLRRWRGLAGLQAASTRTAARRLLP